MHVHYSNTLKFEIIHNYKISTKQTAFFFFALNLILMSEVVEVGKLSSGSCLLACPPTRISVLSEFLQLSPMVNYVSLFCQSKVVSPGFSWPFLWWVLFLCFVLV